MSAQASSLDKTIHRDEIKFDKIIYETRHTTHDAPNQARTQRKRAHRENETVSNLDEATEQARTEINVKQGKNVCAQQKSKASYTNEHKSHPKKRERHGCAQKKARCASASEAGAKQNKTKVRIQTSLRNTNKMSSTMLNTRTKRTESISSSARISAPRASARC